MLKTTKQARIGVFDSGLGGLTVLKNFLEALPDYSYTYLGDIARLPYGNKSKETIYKYVCQSLDFLFQQGCPLIIIACNTASAQALSRVQQEYLPKKWPTKKVLGVIRPLAEAAALEKTKQVGVIGTRATVRSQTYSQEIKKIKPSIQVTEQAAPLLVPLIEEAWLKKSVTNKILKSYLRPLKMAKIDYLILACTHYPFLLKKTRHLMGSRCQVPDPGKIVADSLKNYLTRHPELKIKKNKNPQLNFFLTDAPDLFKITAEKFLGQEINNLKQISLEL